MTTVGFIGAGNMGGAIITGLLRGGEVTGGDVLASGRDRAKLEARCADLGCTPAESNADLARRSDIVFLCAKPKQIPGIVADLGEDLADTTVVSVAAGLPVAELADMLPDTARAMAFLPNTPVAVGHGIFPVEAGHTVEGEHLDELTRLLESCGRIIHLEEGDSGMLSVVSGCGPGLVPVLMEAFADAAVKNGVRREDAYDVVARTFLGSATLMLESGKIPAQLKDEVCSPGGTTIRGVTGLDEYGVRAGIIRSLDRIING
ncbi:pyrroline-5-carboxylate reductase [Corynebacterium sp. 335C]